MQRIAFWGDSLEVIRGFPAGARQQAGFQLDRVQRGLRPDDFKPMKSIGQGVEEIRIRDDGNAYRVIYIARFEDAVHVLHAFEKKTWKTRKADLDIARQRLQWLLAQRRNKS